MVGLSQMANGGAPMSGPPMPEQNVNMAEGEQQDVRPLSEEEELDSDIAYGLMASLLLEGDAVKSIQGMSKASNPVPVIAAMISNSVKELATGLQGSDMNVSPLVWLAEGGAVDRAIDLVSDVAGGLPDEVKNAVFSDVVDQIKLMSGGAGQPPQQAQMMGAPQGMMPPAAPMSQFKGGM